MHPIPFKCAVPPLLIAAGVDAAVRALLVLAVFLLLSFCYLSFPIFFIVLRATPLQFALIPFLLISAGRSLLPGSESLRI